MNYTEIFLKNGYELFNKYKEISNKFFKKTIDNENFLELLIAESSTRFINRKYECAANILGINLYLVDGVRDKLLPANSLDLAKLNWINAASLSLELQSSSSFLTEIHKSCANEMNTPALAGLRDDLDIGVTRRIRNAISHQSWTSDSNSFHFFDRNNEVVLAYNNIVILSFTMRAIAVAIAIGIESRSNPFNTLNNLNK